MVRAVKDTFYYFKFCNNKIIAFSLEGVWFCWAVHGLVLAVVFGSSFSLLWFQNRDFGFLFSLFFYQNYSSIVFRFSSGFRVCFWVFATEASSFAWTRIRLQEVSFVLFQKLLYFANLHMYFLQFHVWNRYNRCSKHEFLVELKPGIQTEIRVDLCCLCRWLLKWYGNWLFVSFCGV